MKILPIPPLNAPLTKAIETAETAALKQANQRHLLHYFLKALGDLPTLVIEQINHHLKSPTAKQYPHADAHMRLILGLNHKLKPAIQIDNLVPLRQEFATEMVAIQSPSVWQQASVGNTVKTKPNGNININANINAVSWQDKIIANADGGEMIIRCYQADPSTVQNLEKNHNNHEQIVMMFFHGGGFCLGDVNTEHEFCHAVCAQTGWAIVSAEYRLAPEILLLPLFETGFRLIAGSLNTRKPLARHPLVLYSRVIAQVAGLPHWSRSR